MAFTNRITTYWATLALILLPWAALAQATSDPWMIEPRQLKQTLCSSQNTASMSANLSIWQTNGLCQDFCRGKNYAFAIVQYQSCWCSDVAPAASTEAEVEDKCNDICPGYDTEKCGSRPNWYGYLQLAKAPTSTAGSGSGDTTSAKAPTPSTSTTQAPPAPPPAPPATTVQVTVTETEKPQHTTTPDSEATTSTLASSTLSKPKTTVQTITADGTVRTIFVTPTATGSEGANGASELAPGSQSGSEMSTGSVVGIVVGVIIAVVAFAGLFLFWFFRRRKQRKENDKYNEPSHRGSSAGMTSSPRNPEMVVTVEGGRWDADSTSDHRHSRLMAHDPRMEPLGRGLYVNNKSAESINTLRDDQDYSRKVHKPILRATNPDPE